MPIDTEKVRVGAQGGHKSTQRVLAVIDLLASEGAGLSMADVSRVLDIPKGTLSPILKTMVAERFLDHDEASGEFSLGIKTYLAGRAYEKKGGEVAFVREVMGRVMRACGETCQLAVMDGPFALYIEKVDSPAPVKLVTDVGTRLPLYCTAVGKAMLSRLDGPALDARVPDALERRTPNTVEGREALDAQLEEVRRLGYSHETGEVLEDVECYAVAISKDGVVRYGLGVSTPRYRMDDEHRERIVSALIEAQAELSRRL